MSIDSTPPPQFLCNRFGESYLPEVNRHLFDAAPSSSVFERRLTVDFEADDTLFVILGTDSGLLQEYLRGVSLGKGSRRLLIESDDLHALIAPRAAPDTEAATLCAFSDLEKALQGIDLGSYAHGGRVELVESLGCRHDHTGVYMPILRQVRAHLTTLVHRQRVIVSGQVFMRKQVHNACENRLPVNLLHDVGVGHTAVVLGGGPSLDASLDWVIAHRDSVFLITASRLCGKLQRLGLCPDVVVAVDPDDGMYDLSKEGILWEETLLAHSYHLAPQLLHQWRGPCLYFGELNPWDKPGEGESGNFSSLGPTVSHTAAWLAYCWNFDRILMCGVDMCYTVGGATHTTGSVESMLGMLPSECEATVVTYSGRLAGTGRALQHGAECLEDLGLRVNAHGPRLFNTNPDAARIDSVPLIDLAEIEPEGSRPRIVLPDESPSRAEHLQRVRREHTDAARRFKKIIRRCGEAIRLLDAMEAALDDESFHKHRQRLDRLEKTIGKENGRFYDVIKEYGARALLASIKPSGFEEDTQSQEWGRKYYCTIRYIARSFIELLQSSQERTSMRLAELDDAPDVDALLDYWSSDRTPGRVLSLRERLPSDTSDAATARVESEARAFLATIEDGETQFANQLRGTRMNPENLLRNVNFLFREEVTADLAVLADGLLALAPPHDLFAFHTAGLHAELEGEFETALSHYQRVLDRFGEWVVADEETPEGFEPLLEESLQHITQCYLQLGDGESAVGALALLVQLAPYYLSQYAHLLHLLGRHTEALETLELRLQDAPGDWRTLLQIADIYSAIGSAEAATMARRLAEEARENENPVDLAA